MAEAAAPDAVFTHEIRVAWGDCDPERIVYTGRIPWFALDAINAWWEHHTGGEGWYHFVVDRGFGLPFVHMSFDFRAPITPRHRLKCRVWPTKLGETSISFRVEGYQAETLCFEGRFTSVFVITDEFRKTRPPEDIRAIVQALLRPDAPDSANP